MFLIINMYLLVFESEICKFHETHLISGNIFFHFRALLDTPPIPGGVKQLMMPSNARSLKKIWLLKQFVVFGMDVKKFWIFTFNFKMSKKSTNEYLLHNVGQLKRIQSHSKCHISTKSKLPILIFQNTF